MLQSSKAYVNSFVYQQDESDSSDKVIEYISNVSRNYFSRHQQISSVYIFKVSCHFKMLID